METKSLSKTALHKWCYHLYRKVFWISIPIYEVIGICLINFVHKFVNHKAQRLDKWFNTVKYISHISLVTPSAAPSMSKLPCSYFNECCSSLFFVETFCLFHVKHSHDCSIFLSIAQHFA